jgi:membrane-associated phospholipid phosphatase
VGVSAFVVLTSLMTALGLAIGGSRTGLDWVADGDVVVDGWLEAVRSSGAEPVLVSFSGATDPFTVIGVVGAVAAVLALTRRWRAFTVLVVAVQVELAVFLAASTLVGRPRPDSAPDVVPVTGSFPSGHAAMAVALWGSMAVIVWWHTDRRPARWAAVVVAVGVPSAVGVARLVDAVHHTSDVVAGLLLGIAALGVGLAAAKAVPVEDGPRSEAIGAGSTVTTRQ